MRALLNKLLGYIIGLLVRGAIIIETRVQPANSFIEFRINVTTVLGEHHSQWWTFPVQVEPIVTVKPELTITTSG